MSLILTALVFTAYNFALNGHYHRTAEGVLIYHYHPYEHTEDKNSESGSHSHSELQYVNLEINSHSRFFVVIAAIILWDLYHSFEEIIPDYYTLPCFAGLMHLPLFRAPPLD